jgi:MFS family permease
MTAGHSTRQSAAAESIHRNVVLASAVTALGGLLFGYDTGVVSGALLFLKNDFGGLSSFQWERVTSLLLVGAAVGALFAGRIADRIGRRPTVLGTALVFIVGGRHVPHRVQLRRRRDTARRGGGHGDPGLLIYTGSFAIGLGPVFWLLISEIYPLTIRGAATIANWAANFVVTISFLTIKNAIGAMGVFLLFGCLTLVALLYFWREVPETKGRSLQEIERDLVGRAVSPGGR